MKLSDNRPILIVEDSDEDFEATLWALRKSSVEVSISRCRDGEQALDYLEHRGKFAETKEVELPALILLDLNLPRTDGREVLEHIKASARLRKVPVVVITTSANPRGRGNLLPVWREQLCSETREYVETARNGAEFNRILVPPRTLAAK